MFLFFPDNYMWSQAILRLLFNGGAPGEALKGAAELAPAAGSYDGDAWFETWRKLGDQLWDRGRQQAAGGHAISARSSFLRSCSYYQWAIGFMDHHDARRREIHQRSLEVFGRFAELSEPPIERVEVPYEGSSYPAWFIPGQGTAARKPTVFYLPGWDSTKEQGIEFGLAMADRGFNAMLVDWPGMGEAVLFRGMANRHDEEVPGAAAVDFLAARPDVDAERIIAVGASMGGYRVSRVAAFEHRLAAAVAWGAVWDFGASWRRRRDNPRGAVSTPTEHALFVMGAQTLDEVDRKMDNWKLEAVAGQIRCPFLVLHGEKDAQLPLEDAYKLYEAAGSALKELKVFTEEEGGSFHCQNDNRLLAHEYIGDWLEDVVLRGVQRGGVVVGPAG
ncbi:MAG TPA: prolyl oligopeptidase family serine peptidase [Chloroflexota bacterium]|nr:prolyl oligopeptidase family serine peptidase [Chloroflexota bacterium]